MKELKNLEAIRELLASHPIYTYDYSDGLFINKGLPISGFTQST